MTSIRKALAIVSLWLPAAAILVTWVMWQHRLPTELPTHWGASGPADAATHGPTIWGWLFAIAAAAALIGTVLLLIPLKGKWTQRAIGGVTGAIGAYALSMWLMSSATALDVTDPYTVELGAWAIPSTIAPLYAAVPLLLFPRVGHPPASVEDPTPVTPIAFAPNESVSWSRTVSSWLFIIMTTVMIAIGMLIFVPAIMRGGLAAVSWTAVPFLLATLVVAAFCAFRVTVDWRGLRVTSLLFGIPIKRVSPESIAAVEVATLEPMQWGGWGYRIMPGRSAVILRKGPSLVVTQRNEKQFAISLERPEEPASILLNVIGTEQQSTL